MIHKVTMMVLHYVLLTVIWFVKLSNVCPVLLTVIWFVTLSNVCPILLEHRWHGKWANIKLLNGSQQNLVSNQHDQSPCSYQLS